jgi:uncharacterized protein (DUF305 family)
VIAIAEFKPADVPAGRAHRSQQRSALVVLGVVAVLAVGFALGSLVRAPVTSGAVSNPVRSSVDVGFAQDMIVVDLQAVTLANEALMTSTDPVVRSAAFGVASAQQNQIGQMQGWLSLWGQPLLRSGGYLGWLPEAGAHPPNGPRPSTSSDGTVAVMPGMASTAELTALHTATGAAFDVLYLQLITRHHHGGAQMLSYAADHAVNPVVRNFASQVGSSQSAEVTYMTQLLTARGAKPLPS